MCGMTIWILAILLMTSTALAGWRQGAIRAAFSFVGILFAALLAGLIGKLVHPLLPHLGTSNPVTAWALAPIVGFIIVSVAFKVAAQSVHHRVEHFYKYKAGDLRLALWTRINTRLGICVGLMNGVLYFILISFVIFNMSYWTTQVTATPAKQSIVVRLVNDLGEDLQSSGLDRTACAVATMPPMFYQLADVAGMLMQNPKTGSRLADYPGLMSLWERDDMQALVTDNTVTNAPAAGAKLGTILDDQNVVAFLHNKELTQLVSGILKTNVTDLMEYLKTGKSPKYSGQKIIGRWDLNPAVTFAWLRQSQPKMSINEVRAVRAFMFQNYADTHLLVAGDRQAFLKHFPHVQASPGQPPTTDYENWKGDWSADGTNYDLHLTLNGQDKFMSATAEELRLTLKDGKTLLIFDRAD
jgi:uncharacterized membrane protein required for colicin V production